MTADDRPTTASRRPADPRAASATARCGPTARSRSTGEFAYSSDLWLDEHAVRRHPAQPAPAGPDHAASTSRRRWPLPGVHAVLTHEDVPGAQALRARRTPTSRCSPSTRSATRASRSRSSPPTDPRDRPPGGCTRIVVDLRGAARRSPTPAPRSLDPAVPRSTRAATWSATSRSGTGDPDAGRADVVVVGEYEVGMQDQAFLGPESGLAVPAEDGGVDLYVATQWLHVDQRQIAPLPRPAARRRCG